MKIKIFIFLLLTGLLITAFTKVSSKGEAIVEQQQGLYLFLLSKPTFDYDYLGSVKVKLPMTGEPEEMLRLIIKKVKKEFPNSDSVIFTSKDMATADAIKFK